MESFIANSDQVSSNLDGDTVILNLADGTYYSLNAVGTVIWQRLQQPSTLATLHAAVVDTFDIAEDVAAAHLRTLLEEMTQAGLVRQFDL
jgi:hypothetical protein